MAALTLPNSFTFRAAQQQQLTWTLSDPTGAPVTGATVTATLYQDRSREYPQTTPGTPVTNFNGISLPESATPGTYVATIPATFNPATSPQFDFVLVVTALNGSVPLGTWERPAVVLPPQLSQDLVLLDDLKQWLCISQDNTSDDYVFQLLISAFSQYFLNKTGIDSFKQINTYTEIYDGRGNTVLFLRNRPILSIVSLSLGGFSPQISTDVTSPGIYISQDQKSIAFRSGYTKWPTAATFIYPYAFPVGQGNIQVTYTAGYAEVPADVQEICMEAVATLYKRKDWIDLKSKALAAGGSSGTTTYRDWAFNPWIERVTDIYSRYARY